MTGRSKFQKVQKFVVAVTSFLFCVENRIKKTRLVVGGGRREEGGGRREEGGGRRDEG